MNYREFYKFMDELPGGKKPTVRITNRKMDPFLEGTYLEKGMLADVIAAKEKVLDGQNVIRVLFDFSNYWEHNKEFESSLWLLPPDAQEELGRLMGTMREAGVLPKGQEEYLFPEDREIDFEILEDQTLCLYNLWVEERDKAVSQGQKEPTGYIQWLENIVAKRICG